MKERLEITENKLKMMEAKFIKLQEKLIMMARNAEALAKEQRFMLKQIQLHKIMEESRGARNSERKDG